MSGELTFDPYSQNWFNESLRWSPNGGMIAFSFAQNLSFDDEGNLQGSQGPHQDIFVAIIGNNDLVNLTNSESVDILPRWLPDSRRIAFVSDRDGNNEIYIINIDGTGLIRLTNHPANDRLPQVP